MGISLGDELPNFEVETSQGKLKLHDYMKDHWLVLFSHPADFTPVCTTELAKIATHQEEFDKRGVKLIGLSSDTTESHAQWLKDVEAYLQASVKYPVISDPDRKIASQLNMTDPDAMGSDGKPLANRALHIFAPDKKLKLSFIYPGTTGRNFDEVLRAIDALQLSYKYHVVTPGDWKPGDKVLVPPSWSDKDIQEKHLQNVSSCHLPSGKNYLRLADPPKV